MSCDEVAKILALETLVEEVGGEAALRDHQRSCGACRSAIAAFLADEALLQARFAEALRRSGSRRLVFAVAGVVTLAASLLVALPFGRSTKRPVVARVESVAGTVAVAEGSVVDEEAIGPGFDLREGGTITTRDAATTEVRLADGSVVTVGPVSSMRLGPGRATGVSAYLIHGRVRCRVRPGGGAFRIATPRGEVVAVGTEFEVTYAPARADDAPAELRGVSVMTSSGGLPNAALLTIAVVAGAIEFHDARGQNGAGRVAAVSAQEMLLATGDEAPRVVRMTDRASPIEVPAFDAEHVHVIQRMISALALAPDGKHLAVCVRNMNGGEIGDGGPRFVGIRRWNLESDRFDGFVALDGSPSSAAFTADGRLWATEAMNNEIRRVDFAAGGVAETIDLNLPPNQLTSDDARLYPSPDGSHVVITGFNTSKAIYAYPGWKRVTVLEGPTDCLPCEGAWSRDGKSFVAATLDDAIRIWPVPAAGGARPRSAGTGIAPRFGPDQRVWALTPDSKAFGPSEAAGDERRAFVCEKGTFSEAAFCPDGMRLALGTSEGTVVVFDVATARRLHVLESTPAPETNGAVSCLLWGPDGSWLAIGRYDGSSCIVRFDAK